MNPILRYALRTRNRLALRRFWRGQHGDSRFAFIHINKCGGTSVEKALGLPKVHDTAQQRVERIGWERWNRMHSFALIRHPYAKVVSHYKYRVKTDQTGLGGGAVDLNEWIRRAYGDQEPELHDQPIMFAPCVEWLRIDGEIVVRQIVKLEEIASEWPAICRNIGRPGAAMAHANRTSSNSLDEARSLLDAESVRILRDRFAEDFDRFDYER
jgi:hypothetical protein